jgi:hypothetical protein
MNEERRRNLRWQSVSLSAEEKGKKRAKGRRGREIVKVIEEKEY